MEDIRTEEIASLLKEQLNDLNIDWDEAFLSPHKNPRAVMTASNIQVMEKIYQGSSNSWKNFQPFLNGALDNIVK